MGKVIADLKIWERRMRLREYFFEENEEKENCQKEYSKFKKSSNFTPSPGRERWLDEYIQTVKDEILSRLSRKFKMNITTEEEKPLPDNAITFVLDVTKLYPSVPRKEAREVCKTALENRSDISIPTEDVLKMMDLVIENNNFSFNGKHFLQTEGTAIGSHLGMNYACTYLGQ
ncbi:unnamed protein product [Mytilus coruscus]|uniref:Reverse transcriptase domain-containing protein n=1 Tax=Mytilus coruscus TaxID=42192 RepID=A0A6J8CVB9_MYTCO|nr:unnamed protein product [Mytilus coruscus]